MTTEKKQALTGVKEEMTGFVGKWALSNLPCTNGRHRIRFDFCAGNDDIQNLKLATWRKCYGYDRIADELKDLRPGDYLRVTGVIRTEVVRDINGKPVFLFDGRPARQDVLLINSYAFLNHDKTQGKFEGLLTGELNPAKVESVI